MVCMEEKTCYNCEYIHIILMLFFLFLYTLLELYDIYATNINYKIMVRRWYVVVEAKGIILSPKPRQTGIQSDETGGK